MYRNEEFKPKAVLTKKEAFNLLGKILKEEPKTQMAKVFLSVKDILKSRGDIGKRTVKESNLRISGDVKLHETDYLLINECFYDLLYGRVITPGIDESNGELPWIRLSNEENLKKYMNKDCQSCEENKTLDQYYKNSTKPDGLNGICIECQGKVNEKNKK